MDQSASTSTSDTTYTHGTSGQSLSKERLESFDGIHDPEHRTSRRRPTWTTRLQERFASSSPRAYSWLSRAVNYCRGPRPPIDLPDPKPLLDIDITIRGRRIVAPIESTFIRKTRYLTSPRLFAVLTAAYIIGFAFFSRAQSFLTPPDSFIGCTSTYWLALNGCGIDGVDCQPFSNDTFDFRCPAQCSSVILQNPRTIGDEQMDLVPLIVGGGDDPGTYRGDSFICAAAVQAGVINDRRGGCGTLELVGNFTDYQPKTAHGLSSVGFETVFPLSFRFASSTPLRSCDDNRDAALAFNVLVTCIIFFLLRPKPIVAFWCLICIGFWHISLFSQPSGSPPDLSNAFAYFLPSLFIAYAFWRLAVRFTLRAFSKAPIEAGVWYLGPYWVTVLANVTMDRIPISRLYASDIRRRAGAGTALAIIIVVLFFVVLNQVRVMRKTGWLPHYLRWYVTGGLVVLVLSQLPGLDIRLHHYIIAMVLIPGTAFPTRLCAFYQGFLIGLFLNGAAAFGLDSVLQTPTELRQDAAIGSDLPTFATNSSNFNTSIPFAEQLIFWNSAPEGWNGFSLLVDDVERFAGDAFNFSLAAFNASLPHFFRLALTSDGTPGDYTMPATLWPNGTWVDPLPGPS